MIKIYGASDDLIEVEGDIEEEFGVMDGDYRYLAFSNGFLVRVHYDSDGEWRIMVLRKTSEYKFVPPDRDKDEYSDVVEIPHADWVVYGSEWAKA